MKRTFGAYRNPVTARRRTIFAPERRLRRSSEPIKAAQLQQRGQLGHIVNLRPRGSLPRSTRLHGTSGGVGRRRCSFWACTVRAATRLPSNGSAQTARRLFCWFSTDRRQGLVACHRGSNARSVRIRGRCTVLASVSSTPHLSGLIGMTKSLQHPAHDPATAAM